MPFKAAEITLTLEAKEFAEAFTGLGRALTFANNKLPSNYLCIQLDGVNMNSDGHGEAWAIDDTGYKYLFALWASPDGTVCLTNGGRLVRLEKRYCLIIGLRSD